MRDQKYVNSIMGVLYTSLRSTDDLDDGMTSLLEVGGQPLIQFTYSHAANSRILYNYQSVYRRLRWHSVPLFSLTLERCGAEIT